MVTRVVDPDPDPELDPYSMMSLDPYPDPDGQKSGSTTLLVTYTVFRTKCRTSIEWVFPGW